MSARSYLVYEGPGDLRVEMGLCDVVPAKGQLVDVDGVQYRVWMVQWNVYSGQDANQLSPRHPNDWYPQQCATVTLRRVKR